MHLRHPDWLVTDPEERFPDDGAAMARAVALAAENVARGTGGPFGAVVLGPDRRLAGAGVNVVVASGSSLAHAEVMALLDAQRRTGRPRLNDEGGPWTLVTSAQPCAMCFGACFWAGLDALVVGARAEDVEALAGFDEGPLPADWPGELAARGIALRRDVGRAAAQEVLRAYGQGAGTVY